MMAAKWQRVDETTWAMNVPFGCLVKVVKVAAVSITFVPGVHWVDVATGCGFATNHEAEQLEERAVR